jgi:hypothetical protein
MYTNLEPHIHTIFISFVRVCDREKMEPQETPALLQSQAEILQHIYILVDSLALKCVVELHIADIIHSHSGPITFCQIASKIDSPSPNIAYLTRIIRSLVCKNIFAEHHYPVQCGRGHTLRVDANIKMAFA